MNVLFKFIFAWFCVRFWGFFNTFLKCVCWKFLNYLHGWLYISMDSCSNRCIFLWSFWEICPHPIWYIFFVSLHSGHRVQILPMQVSCSTLAPDFPEAGKAQKTSPSEGPEDGFVFCPVETTGSCATWWYQGELHVGGGMARSLQRKGSLGAGPGTLPLPSPLLGFLEGLGLSGLTWWLCLQICIQQGWKPPRPLDVPPLLLQANGNDPELFQIPPELVLGSPPSGTPSKRAWRGEDEGGGVVYPVSPLPNPRSSSCLSSSDRG